MGSSTKYMSLVRSFCVEGYKEPANPHGSLHVSYLPTIEYLSIYLAYFSSIHCCTYFCLYFVLFLDLSMYLSIYLLVVDFLMHLRVHLFDVCSLSTKFFLQTLPDFTDRIFRWSFHHSEPL